MLKNMEALDIIEAEIKGLETLTLRLTRRAFRAQKVGLLSLTLTPERKMEALRLSTSLRDKADTYHISARRLHKVYMQILTL